MRKAYLKYSEERSKDALGNHSSGIKKPMPGRMWGPTIQPIPYPNMATTKVPGTDINRATVDRLYADSRHIKKILAVYIFLFIGVSFGKSSCRSVVEIADLLPLSDSRLFKQWLACSVM